jgi:cell wall-associated NlpC family hydrolase
MNWSNTYIGIPYADKGRSPDGADCWGLVRLVQAHFGNYVPSYADQYFSADESAEVDAIIQGEKPRWEKVTRPNEGDVVLFAMGRNESHAGVHVEGTKFLHMAREDCAKIEDYNSPVWARRFRGFYRWKP